MMNHRWFGRVIAAALLVWSVSAGSAAAMAQGRGHIVGRVTDGLGRPAPGVAITLLEADSTRVVRRARSEETGGFGFAGLEPGSYRVRAERKDSAVAELRVKVDGGGRSTALLRLRPRSAAASRAATSPL